MKFIVTPGPFQRGKAKTGIIMRDLMIALLIVWVAGIAYNFTIDVAYGFKAILMVVVASLTTLLCDVLVSAIRYKSEKGPFLKNLLYDIRTNFSLITAIIFALTLPLGTPYFVIIIGSLFGTLIVKYAFGGFGHNIFNPAAFARIFVALTFASSLSPIIDGVSATIPTLSSAGATITSAFSSASSALGLKWLSASLDGLNVTLGQLWLGTYSGALGETFAGLIALLGIGLAARKALNWRTPVFFLGTVALTALFIALTTGMNPLEYTLIHLGMGGLMFGAVFMLTDPVSSPTSPFGKALVGIIAGLMTVLIRIQGTLPEGVVFAIAIANVCAPLIDRYASAMTNKNLGKKWALIGGLLFGSLALNGSISIVRVHGANEGSSSSETPVIPFKVLSGTASSVACDEYCELQTQMVDVNLDERFDILSIDLSGENTTGGNFTTKWNEAEADIIAYYESLTLAQIKALDHTALPTEAFEVGVTVTSERLLLAIQDAIKDVEIYTGSATNNAYPEHFADQTTDVVVYVISGVIEAIAVDGEVTTGGNFQTQWDTAYETIYEYYVGMTVADFLTLGAFPTDSDAFVAGLTYSTQRLYDAIVAALATYGG